MPIPIKLSTTVLPYRVHTITLRSSYTLNRVKNSISTINSIRTMPWENIRKRPLPSLNRADVVNMYTQHPPTHNTHTCKYRDTYQNGKWNGCRIQYYSGHWFPYKRQEVDDTASSCTHHHLAIKVTPPNRVTKQPCFPLLKVNMVLLKNSHTRQLHH